MGYRIDSVVIFGVGSSLLVDVVESLARGGIAIAAGVRNHPSQSYLPSGIPTISPEEVAPNLLHRPFFAPFFTPGDRQAVAWEAAALGFQHAATLVDATSIVPADLAIGDGSYVNAGCVLGSASRFGDFTLINRAATIGHHARFGQFVSVGPGAVLAGNVTVGDGAVIGAGATILPNITIGANAVVGAGSVVTKDIPPMCVAVGNPARVVRQNGTGFGGKTVI